MLRNMYAHQNPPHRVKGGVGVGEVALTTNELKTAERPKNDYWLYVVYNCGSKPEIHAVQDPARLGWKPVIAIEHYALSAMQLMDACGKMQS